jgi:DNA-directed RNA polymerase subunit RPC12/RpoP
MIKKKKEAKTIWEWCPNCNDEYEIPKDKITSCPNCNFNLVPCSSCFTENTKCIGCINGSLHPLIK